MDRNDDFGELIDLEEIGGRAEKIPTYDPILMARKEYEDSFEEVYEVGNKKVQIDENKCISTASELTQQEVEKKLETYHAKIESEERIRTYIANELKNNKRKQKTYMIYSACLGAVILGTIMFASEVFAMLFISAMWVAIVLLGVCLFKVIDIRRNLDVVLDPYDLKAKEYNVILKESKARVEIYKKEIQRLGEKVRDMRDEQERAEEYLLRMNSTHKK